MKLERILFRINFGDCESWLNFSEMVLVIIIMVIRKSGMDRSE